LFAFVFVVLLLTSFTNAVEFLVVLAVLAVLAVLLFSNVSLYFTSQLTHGGCVFTCGIVAASAAALNTKSTPIKVSIIYNVLTYPLPSFGHYRQSIIFSSLTVCLPVLLQHHIKLCF
jgi:hypothetical protein